MRPHATDPLSLTFGLIFLGIAVLWLVTRFATVTASALAWTLAGGLVVLGGLGIAYALNPARRRDPQRGSD